MKGSKTVQKNELIPHRKSIDLKINDAYLCRAMKKPDSDSIRKALEENHEWPSIFMFKFIVPSDNAKIAQVEALFNTKTSEIRMRPSKNGNYMSITAKEAMMNVDQVMKCYEDAAKIDGLIAL